MSTTINLILPTSKSSTFDFKLLKLPRTFTSLLVSSLPTWAFKAMQFFADKSDVWTPVAWFNWF